MESVILILCATVGALTVIAAPAVHFLIPEGRSVKAQSALVDFLLTSVGVALIVLSVQGLA